MKSYSLDLRERVVAKVDAGELPRGEIAAFFSVSVGWIKKLLSQRRRLGHVAPLPHGGGHPPFWDQAGLAALRAAVAAKPDATLEELRARVRGSGRRRAARATLSRTLAALGLARKKKVLVAGERDAEKRARYWEFVEGLREHALRLIFVDETGFNTDLVRRYGRAPRGERVVAAVPRHTPPNLTFVGALAPEGLLNRHGAGGRDGLCRLCGLHRALLGAGARAGRRGHHGQPFRPPCPRVGELIESAGAWLLYLPAYSPDFNPIEQQCFSKLKTLLRGIGARTRAKLQRAIRRALNAVTPANAQGWFANLGYWVTPKREPL